MLRPISGSEFPRFPLSEFQKSRGFTLDDDRVDAAVFSRWIGPAVSVDASALERITDESQTSRDVG